MIFNQNDRNGAHQSAHNKAAGRSAKRSKKDSNLDKFFDMSAEILSNASPASSLDAASLPHKHLSQIMKDNNQ